MSSVVSDTKLRSFTLSFFREPINAALIFLLPVVGIQFYGQALASLPASLFDTSAALGTVGRITGAVFAVAALGGVLGLFQVISARDTDRRLLLCGATRLELLLNRFLTVFSVAVFGSAVTVAIMWYTVDVASPVLTAGAFLLVGLMYSLIGILVGSVFPRELEGSLALVFLADMDNFLTSNIIEVDIFFGKVFPLYYPHKLVKSAVVEGSFETTHLTLAVAYLFALVVVTTFAYVYSAKGEVSAA